MNNNVFTSSSPSANVYGYNIRVRGYYFVPSRYISLVYAESIGFNVLGFTNWLGFSQRKVDLDKEGFYGRIRHATQSEINSFCSSSTYKLSRRPALRISDTDREHTPIDSKLEKKDILHAIYPNPTQGLTTVKYELATSSTVFLFLTDITGRRVAEIVSEEVQEAGSNNRKNKITSSSHDRLGNIFSYQIELNTFPTVNFEVETS